MTQKLTEGNPAKVLFFFTLPMLLGNIFQQLYNLSDSFIVGNFINSDALAAVGASFPITFFAIGIATGASMGSSIIISHAFGAGDLNSVKRGISTAIISVMSLGVLLTIASIFFLEPLLKLLKTPADILPDALAYVKIIFLGCISIFAYNCLTSILNALGDSKTPLYFLILSTIINIGLDLFFVIVLDSGVVGAAYATVISQFLATISLFLYFIKKLKNLTAIKSTKIFDFDIAKKMAGIAIPSIIQQSIVSIGMMAVQGLVNSFGKDMVAGYTAATKIDSLAIMPMLNVSIALSSYTAQNFGAKEIERVKAGFAAAIKLVVIFAVIISSVILVFGDTFINAFIDSNASDDVVRYGSEYIKVVCVFYVLMGIMFCSNGIFRGVGKMKIFMLSTFINLVSRIVFAYSLVPFIGYKAIFWAMPIGWFLAGLVSVINYSRGKWKTKA